MYQLFILLYVLNKLRSSIQVFSVNGVLNGDGRSTKMQSLLTDWLSMFPNISYTHFPNNTLGTFNKSFFGVMFGTKFNDRKWTERLRDTLVSDAHRHGSKLCDRVLDTISHDHIVMFGHSHGGMVVHFALEHLREHPMWETIRNKLIVIVCGCPVFIDNSGINIFQFRTRHDKFPFLGRNHMLVIDEHLRRRSTGLLRAHSFKYYFKSFVLMAHIYIAIFHVGNILRFLQAGCICSCSCLI
jgi:hypothetical protein